MGSNRRQRDVFALFRVGKEQNKVRSCARFSVGRTFLLSKGGWVLRCGFCLSFSSRASVREPLHSTTTSQSPLLGCTVVLNARPHRVYEHRGLTGDSACGKQAPAPLGGERNLILKVAPSLARVRAFFPPHFNT